MARLRHSVTGVIVNVSDAKAQTLGATFEPAADDTPAQSATKAEWVEYAVANGVDRDEADAATKAELQARFT